MTQFSKANIEWIKYKKMMEERPQHFVVSNELQIIVDEKKVTDFENKTGITIGINYESAYRIMVVDLVFDGKNYFAYERILPAVDTGAVVIVPIYKGKFIILKQFRHALRDYQYAFPRGFASEGLSAEENCKKELREELGCETKEISFLGTMVADSGLSGDKVNVYLCNIDSYKECQGYEGIRQVVELSLSEYKEYVAKGKINDGYSLAAYAMYVSKGLDTDKIFKG